MKNIILYHGSRCGIMGSIRPASRERCDFGRGFYMGEHREQAAGLVLNEEKPVLYTLKMTIPDDAKILYLDDKDWLYAVLANRQRVWKFDSLAIAETWKRAVNQYDLVVGKIADDKMNDAIKEFARNALTDAALYGCLSRVDYGSQYTAKSAYMCSNIEIIDETPVDRFAFPNLAEQMKELRLAARDVINEERSRHLRDGLFLDEIIERERNRERDTNDYGR